MPAKSLNNISPKKKGILTNFKRTMIVGRKLFTIISFLYQYCLLTILQILVPLFYLFQISLFSISFESIVYFSFSLGFNMKISIENIDWKQG